MVKDYGVCSCGGRIHPQWFFGKKYLECAKCGNPVKNAETNPYAIIGSAGKCPRCEGLVSVKPHGQYCEHCKARGTHTLLIDMGDGRLKYDAESKKLPPVEKAEISGIASGATMEGLEMLAAEEPPEKDDPLESWMEDFDAETERWIRIPHSRDDDFWGGSPPPYYGKGYGKKRIFPNEQEARRDYEKLLREEPESEWRDSNIGVECGCGNFVLKEEPIWNHSSSVRGWNSRDHPIQVYSKNIDWRNYYDKEEPTSEEWEFATRWKEGEKNIVEVEYATKDHLEFERITYMPMRMLEAEGMLGNWEGKKEDESVNCPNCLWNGLESDLVFSGGQYSHRICPECKRKDWEYVEFQADAEDPSVYWWTKGVIMEKEKDRDLTEDDLVNIIELVAVNAPMDSITKGMRQAEQLGDKYIWEILKLAAMGRVEIHGEDAIHSEKLREYQAEGFICEMSDCYSRDMCKQCLDEGDFYCWECCARDSQVHWNAEMVEMVECPHCSEFGDGEIPADIHYDPGDRWEPPSMDVNSWETCEWCDGKGEVTEEEADEIPTWNWDILEPEEPDYDRYEGRYDDWDAETNGDKQLEESIKRTKMSAIRTGLAITTFGIVLWNLWTNKKQEKQISDIMGLV